MGDDVLKSVRCAIGRWLLPFRDFLYPPLCASCDELLDSRESVLCPGCKKSMRVLAKDDPLYCETRGRLLAGGNISELISCFAFDDQGPVQAAMHRLKYQHLPAVGVELGIMLGEHLARLPMGDSRYVVVPVPLHKAQLRERGFNQSQSICDGIARVVMCTVIPHALIRGRNTRSQTTLRRDERRMNVHGAFSLHRKIQDEIRESSVILVDDVITTGATINECAAVLLTSGAKRVIACSVALAG